MATPITVTKQLTVEATIAIECPEFAHWYELGVWWAMYGDGQGKGRYEDRYLIDNVTSHIQAGWYDDLEGGWFPMLGFELGMIHGGFLVCPADTFVALTDPEFSKGYTVGREYYYTEALPEGRKLTDAMLFDTIHGWAVEYKQWRGWEAVLRYCLGCRIGELSVALIPDPTRSLLSDAAPEAVTSTVL